MGAIIGMFIGFIAVIAEVYLFLLIVKTCKRVINYIDLKENEYRKKLYAEEEP